MNLLEKVLKERGISKMDLEAKKEDIFRHPLLKPVVTDFVTDFLISSPKSIKVGILYDTDMDGLLSGAILADMLDRLGFAPRIMINKQKKHGLNENVVKWAMDEQFDYFFIVDSGSGNKKELTYLAEQGMKLIVLDHHMYEPWKAPHNVKIINALDRPDLPKLSGCGVVYRFIEELGKMTNLPTDKYEKYVGITVISDVCSMTDKENRYYVDVLYDYFDKMRNEDKLFRQFPFYGSKKSFFGWTLVPYFNGLIRVGDEKRAMMLVNNLDSFAKMNTIKNDRQRVKDLQATLMNKIYETSTIKELEHTVLLLRKEHGDLSALNGVLANRLIDEYNKNAMVLYGDKDTGMWGGSLRGLTYGLTDLVAFDITALGHEHACGVYMTPDKLRDFATNFEDTKQALAHQVKYDLEISNTLNQHEDLLKIADFNERAFNGTGIEPITVKINGLEKGVTQIYDSPRRRVFQTGKLMFTEFGELDLEKPIKNHFDVVLTHSKPYYELIRKD